MSEKKKVVFIDDDTGLCLMVKEKLEASGAYEVTTLTNPAQAEAVIRQVRPDVLMIDVVMPGRKGPEIIAVMRKDPEFKSLPIIVISGKGEMVFNPKKDEFKWEPNSRIVKERGTLPEGKGAEALAAAYGVNDYISKPFTSDILLQVLADVLASTRKRSPSEEDQGSTPQV